MKKRRLIAMLTAMTLTVSAVMTGCGNNNGKEESVSKEESSQEKVESVETTSSEEESEELEPVTLTYWMGASKTEDADLVVEAVNEYLAEVLPNTTLEMEWISTSEWAEKWSKAMASQQKIDLAWMGWLNKVESEVSMGSLMPIDDLLAEYGTGIVDTLSEAVVEKHRSLDGNLYFLPAWQGMIGGRMGLYLPHENVELAGEGWAEDFQDALYAAWKEPYWEVDTKKDVVSYIEQYLEASKEAGKLGLGFYNRYSPIVEIFCSNTVTTNEIYIAQEGDTYYLEASSSLESPYYYDQEIRNDWYNKRYIREDITSVQQGDVKWSKDVPLKDSYINYFHNAWTDDANKTYTDAAGFQIDVFFVQEVNELTNGFATGAVIPATSENPERAMMLLNLIYTDPTLYQMLVYGIEDTHYTRNADGTITVPENVTYKGPANWQLGTCMNSLQTDASKLDYYQRLKDAEADAVMPILDGFTFDTEPVSVELSNVQAVVSEYYSAYVNDNWYELLEERRDKMIAAGIETVLNEYYEQLSVYAEEKGMKVEIRGF